MSKITLRDVARAAFWLQFTYNSQCPYCGEELARDKKYVLWHLSQEHPDIAYKSPQGNNDKGGK